MDDPIKIKSKAAEELIAKFKCTHEKSELRKRVVDKGVIQFVAQCLRCGDPTTSPLARAKAVAQCGGQEPPPFDEELQSSWEQGYSSGWKQINLDYEKNVAAYEKARKERTTEWWAWYIEYLKSPEWREKSKQVILRAQGICEGCRAEKATSAHHLTYAHAGSEFLFELVAVCNQCHERLHANGEDEPTEP